MTLQEVIIQTRQAVQEAVVTDCSLVEKHPPVEHFELAEDTWITRLDHTVAEEVMDCCEPRLFGMPKAVRQSPQLYAFVRVNSGEESIWDWQPDQRLEHCVALSRLVHPTSFPLSRHAKIKIDSDGKLLQLIPMETGIPGAWIVGRDGRDWLTEADARKLTKIVARLPLSVPSRVSRSLWYFEMAARSYYAEVRWTLIATGLEAIIHTEKHRSTHQFRTRTAKLASALKIKRFTEDAALNFYDLRSRLSHGHGLSSLTDRELALYALGEDILRAVLLRAIVDDTFASTFADDRSVVLNWAK